MAKVELTTRLENLNIPQFMQELDEWSTLPSARTLTDESYKQLKELLNPSGPVGGFLRWEKRRAVGLINKGEMQEAWDLIKRSSDKGKREYSGLAGLSVEIQRQALRGMFFEYLATHGDYQESPLRGRLFLTAAQEYMEIDRGLRVMTPYAQRTAECLGGAGLVNVGRTIVRKVYGSDNVIFIGSDGKQRLEEMIKKHGSRKICSVPFGGNVRLARVPGLLLNSIALPR